LQSQVAIQAYTLFGLNILELVLPSIMKYIRGQDKTITEPESILINDVIQEENEDVHDDYLEIILQFAMNFTFGAACFEVYIIAFLNNILEVRVDLYK